MSSWLFIMRRDLQNEMRNRITEVFALKYYNRFHFTFSAFCILAFCTSTSASNTLTPSEKSEIAQALVINSMIDQQDRVEEILTAAQPTVKIQQIKIARMVDAQTYYPFVQGPVDLATKRLVVLEDVPLLNLESIPTTLGSPLLAALPTWIEQGGHLIVIGGPLSIGNYAGSTLEAILPVKIKPDPQAKQFLKAQKRSLHGMESNGVVINYLHPIQSTSGDIWLEAKGAPFVVHQRRGQGSATIILSGVYGQLFEDQFASDEKEFFASSLWEKVLLRVLDTATHQTHTLELQEHNYDIPAYRSGSVISLDTLFPEKTLGTVTLLTPQETVAQKETILREANGNLLLADSLRPGVYTLRLNQNSEQFSTKIRVGTPADPKRFEIRNFRISNSPYPYALSRGEAYQTAISLKSVGFTSSVFAINPNRPQNDRRALYELAAAEIDVIDYLSVRRNQPESLWTRYQFPLPLRANKIDGTATGWWDVHDENFRRGIALALRERKADFTLPGLRAMQVIEEFEDGGMHSPSLTQLMHQQGITGKEKPQETGWLLHQRLRSDATGKTFQYFRFATQQFVPNIAHASYWPGSYWEATEQYTYRPQELANAVDELLGPGYGYTAEKYDRSFGWLSVARSAAEIFSVFDHGQRPKTATYVYAQGQRLLNDTDPEISTWQETIWTALAHGVSGLAYFALPPIEWIMPIGKLHQEVLEYGNWIGSLPRKPAPVAILTSWTTRTAGSPEQVTAQSECSAAFFATLSLAGERIDFLQEEQLGKPPQELKTIFLTETAFLQEEDLQSLSQFVEHGGSIFLDATSWNMQDPQTKKQYTEHFTKLAETTKRVHTIPILAGCTAARGARRITAQYWAKRLREEVVLGEYVTENLDTEIALRGNHDVVAALGVNHALDPQTLAFSPSKDLLNFAWINLRTQKRVHLESSYEQILAGRDAFALLGVRKPAVKLSMTVYTSPNRFVFRTCGIDANNQPLADDYPLGLRVTNELGEDRILPGNRSRVTQNGCADWRIFIPLTDTSKHWNFEAFDPISGKTLGDRVPIPQYPSTL